MASTFAIQRSLILTAANSLGELTKILRESHQDYVIEKLVTLFNGKDDELRDVAALGELLAHFADIRLLSVYSALKTIVTNIPDNLVSKACAKVGPRLLKQLHNVSRDPPISHLSNEPTALHTPGVHFRRPYYPLDFECTCT